MSKMQPFHRKLTIIFNEINEYGKILLGDMQCNIRWY